jgi:hypothetical protein
MSEDNSKRMATISAHFALDSTRPPMIPASTAVALNILLDGQSKTS